MKIHLHKFIWMGTRKSKGWYICRCGQSIEKGDWLLDDTGSMYQLVINPMFDPYKRPKYE